MKYIVLVLILVSFSINGIAQKSDNLISKLEEKLFHSDERRILFSEYLKAYDEACGYVKYDTSIQIRAIQPNPDTVSAILYQLMMKNDTSDFQPILALYHRHIEYFKVEWGSIYLANFYACDIVDRQYRILCEFENVLMSLKLKGNTGRDLALKYKNDIFLKREFVMYIPKREELKSKFSHFSDYFKTLRDKGWLGSRAVFTPFEPYFDQMKSYILEDFYAFKFESENETDEYEYNYRYIHHNVTELIVNKYFNDSVRKSILNNLEMWLTNEYGFIRDLIEKGHLSDEKVIIKFLRKAHENPELSKNCPERCQYEWMYRLNQSQIWRGPAKKMLKDDAKSNSVRKLNSINLLQHFPDDDVVSFLVSLNDANQLNKETSEVLNQTLKELANNKEISKESKKMIEKELDNIK